MKIEKKKVSQSKPLSTATKSAIAATLGMAAAFTLNACDDSSSPTSGQVVEPINSSSSEEPLGGDAAPEDVIPPESSDSQTANSSSEAATPASSETAGPETSSETVTPASSSSQVAVDIPQSAETFSSSVLEALSSAAESSSSQKQPTIEELCDGTPGGTTVEYNSLLYVCPDHNGPGMIASMVTTFEKTDLDV